MKRLFAAILILVAGVFLAAAQQQNFGPSLGGTNIFTGGNTFTGSVFVANLNNIIYADQQAGADLCAKINAALLLLPAGGGTVDARGLQGNQSCAANPYAGYTGTGIVLLGSTSIRTFVTLGLPASNRLIGINSRSTKIFADGTMPSGYIIQAGNGGTSNEFGMGVLDIKLDCNGAANCLGGINSTSASEETLFERLIISNIPTSGNGIFLDGSGSNKTEYITIRNIENFLVNTATTNTAHGIYVKGVSPNHAGPGVIENVTSIGVASHVFADSVLLEGVNNVTLNQIRGEQATNVLHIGDTTLPSRAITASSIQGAVAGTNVVTIENASTSGITVSGISRFSTFTNTINDIRRGYVDTVSTYRGLYTTDGPNKFDVTADFTDANSAALQAITGLTWSLGADAGTFNFHCSLMYSQATPAAGDQFGVGIITTAPTQANFYGTAYTNTGAAPAPATGILNGLATTTPTAVVTFTPAVATVLGATLDGTIETAGAGAATFNVYVLNGTAANVIVVKRGSYCSIY